LVELMDGEIQVESEMGKGSVFSFTAVFKPGDAEKVQAEKQKKEAEAPFETEHGLKILLAEDNPVNFKVAMKFLEQLGHDPVNAGDGKQVLTILGQARFDLVLMDLEMPEMDGLEASRRIRAGEAGDANRKIPIIAMTAHTVGDIREKCEAAGMNDVVTKPVDFYELNSIIKGNILESDTVVSQSTEKRLAHTQNEILLDKKGTLRRFGGDEAFLGEVYKLFPKEASAIIEKLREAIRDNDIKEIAMQAHKFKGTSGAIGAESCQIFAARLEHAAIEEKTEQIIPIFERLEQDLEKVYALISE
ncbi:response regulator, partial [Desulfobacterales bacterium HSG2]|nr:response regulator [Desulfobacterales bacterium HSG2]